MANDIPEDAALSVLARSYGKLGPVRGFRRLDAPVVTSALFVFDCEAGRLCLKLPQYQKVRNQAGTDGELDAWRLIGEVRARLFRAGVNVEEQIATDDGAWAGRDHGRLHWVARFYSSQPYTGSTAQIRAAGRLLGQFHREGAGLVAADAQLREQISRRLYRDMPLDDSVANLDRIEASLFDRNRPYPADMQGVMNEIREAYARDVTPALAKWQQTAAPLALDPCLTHNDFHPANILYRPDDAPPVMLDLEQTRLGPLLKCLGFSLCRFSFESRRLGGTRGIGEGTAAFMQGYLAEHGLTRSQLALIPDWIRAYELEKVLRILRFYLFDGLYPQNVRKLLTHHIPLVREAASYSVI